MGESTPQVNPLTSQRAGSVSLADWLDLSAITPALANQLNLLVPSQEMRPFQRKISQREIVAAVAQNQQPIFQALVPDDEAWRLHWMTYFFNDNVDHTVRLSVTPRLQQPDSLMKFAQQIVSPATDTPVYPAIPFTADSNGLFNVRGGPRPEFFPGDLLLFVDETVRNDAVAGLARLMFRYELIPLPTATATDDTWVVNVIP